MKGTISRWAATLCLVLLAAPAAPAARSGGPGDPPRAAAPLPAARILVPDIHPGQETVEVVADRVKTAGFTNIWVYNAVSNALAPYDQALHSAWIIDSIVPPPGSDVDPDELLALLAYVEEEPADGSDLLLPLSGLLLLLSIGAGAALVLRSRGRGESRG